MGPAALSRRSRTEPHDHAVAVYHDRDELRGFLAAFVEDGVERRHLIIFVHAFRSDGEAWRFVEVANPAAARDKDVVLVSLYKQAFEGAGERIDFDHVVRVVDGLLVRAAAAGRAGVGIFVDASRMYLDAAREREWFEFEARLGRRLHHAVALVCAYTTGHAEDPRFLPDMLRTHAYRFEPAGQPPAPTSD